jgi:hypothetical protein
MVVHHVEVDDVGAGGDDIAHFLAKAGEIGGQDAGGDAESGHGKGRALMRMRYFTLSRGAPLRRCIMADVGTCAPAHCKIRAGNINGT